MRKLCNALALLAILAVASGCAAAVGKVAEPVLGLASEDATATIEWIDAQVAAGNLGPTDAANAKACPEAVLHLNALRQTLTEVETPDGFKGLIFYGTVRKYGDGQRDQVVRGVTGVAADCLPLVPRKRLLSIF